jgi:hypothetical protein
LRRGSFAAACAATADLFAEQPVAFLRRGMQIVVLRGVARQPDEAFAILDAAAARGWSPDDASFSAAFLSRPRRYCSSCFEREHAQMPEPIA